MSSSPLRARIAALRAQASAVGAQLAAEAAGLEPGELFEIAGELQGVGNAVEGAQLVAIAHASSLEIRLTGRGPVDVRHEVGFVDAMASSEVSLATGLGQWAAGRKVGLAANLSSRFPKLLDKVIDGDLATVNAAKVITACDGLDDTACAAVQDVLVDRLVAMDPARVTTIARKVATRIAGEQVAAAQRKNRKDRLVQVTPGPDGATDWWARLPAGRSAAAWAAVRDLGDTYATNNPDLTLDQARADALMDLLLTNVTVTAHLTLGIPILTGPAGDAARDAALADHTTENQTSNDTGTQQGDSTANTPSDTNTGTDRANTTGSTTSSDDTDTGTGTQGDRGPVCTAVSDPDWVRPAYATGGQGTGGLATGGTFSISAALISGCEIPGIGFIDADTIENLLTIVPTDIGRALLDARTGTLIESVTTAYRPPKALTDFVTTRDGTCRMWGCNRPAVTCDIDHAQPWPHGPTSPANLAGLCRRHHRLKQRRRWTYHLAPDGTATWTSPTGKQRTTAPDLTALPPPPPVPASTSSPARALTAAEPPPF